MLSGVIDRTLLCCEDDNFTSDFAFGLVTEEVSDTRLTLIVARTVIPIILTVGIIGNLWILIVLSAPMFRGIAYLYLNGLAFSNVGVLVSWIPICFRLGYGMRNDYSFAFYHAHLEVVAVNGFAAAGILIMTCLTIDRYILVFFPARIHTGSARRNVGFFVLSCLVLGFTMSAPLAGMRSVYQKTESDTVAFGLRDNYSVTSSVTWSLYIWMMEIIVRICPSTIFVILNGLVIKRFMQLNAKKREFNAVSDKFRTGKNVDVYLLTRNKGYREEQRLAVLTTIMILCFVLTMIPVILASILRPRNFLSNQSYRIFRMISVVVELSNFALHAFVYSLCSRGFRKESLRLLLGKCREDETQDNEQPVGEIEDFSRHGTTVRLTPEQTKLNSPGSPSKLDTVREEKETKLLSVDDTSSPKED